MCTMTRYLQIHYAKLAINNNLSLLQGPTVVYRSDILSMILIFSNKCLLIRI